MLENLLNSFDPPAFFTTAPLWVSFILPGAALSPALKAYGVTEPFPTMVGNFIAFIANTLCFFMVVIACFGAGRFVARIADRRETRRKYLEARALERATRD